MKAACQNAVPLPEREINGDKSWVRCGWKGLVSALDEECPRCGNKGRLEPVVEVSEVGGVE